MKPLSLLLTNVTLSGRTGTEFFVRDLAWGLLRAGHRPVVYSPDLGALAAEIADLGVAVTDSLDGIVAPDLIHGHHTLPTLEALLFFPGVPAIYVLHDRTALHDTPFVHPRLRRHVAVDERCRERLFGQLGLSLGDTEVIPNAVDLERFTRRSPLPRRPRRALLLSNYATEEVVLHPLAEACRRRGVTLDVAGAQLGGSTPAPERILGGYDLVFGKARCALEAMAVGCATVVCDQAGLAGLVTPENWPAMRRLNFGAATLTEPLRVESLEREIARYDPEKCARVTDRTRAEANSSLQVERFVELYRRVLAEDLPGGDESRCAAGAVRSLFPAWSAVAELSATVECAQLRSSALQRELDQLRSTTAFRLREALLRRSPRVRGLGLQMARWFLGPRRA